MTIGAELEGAIERIVLHKMEYHKEEEKKIGRT